MSETVVSSFMIRFVQEAAETAVPANPWHGVIRHVQSDAELRFTRIEDALHFMSDYVNLVEDPAPTTADEGDTQVHEP